MNNPKILLECCQLSKSYIEGTQHTNVLTNINFKLYTEQLVAIIGSSGSGKSTLLHLLSGLDQPDTGQIYYQGNNIVELSIDKKAQWRNQHIGFVYQFHHLLPDFSALENTMLPLLIAGNKYKLAQQRATNVLKKVGLGNKLPQRPAELSGGERQRVAIARALVNQPSIVMADEPTGNLDRVNAQIIFELFMELNQQKGITCLVVTHDLELADKLTYQWHMHDGQLQKRSTLRE